MYLCLQSRKSSASGLAFILLWGTPPHHKGLCHAQGGHNLDLLSQPVHPWSGQGVPATHWPKDSHSFPGVAVCDEGRLQAMGCPRRRPLARPRQSGTESELEREPAPMPSQEPFNPASMTESQRPTVSWAPGTGNYGLSYHSVPAKCCLASSVLRQYLIPGFPRGVQTLSARIICKGNQQQTTFFFFFFKMEDLAWKTQQELTERDEICTVSHRHMNISVGKIPRLAPIQTNKKN